MADFFRDDGDHLDGCGTGADNRDTLVSEIDLLLGPSGGVERLTLEAVDALD